MSTGHPRPLRPAVRGRAQAIAPEAHRVAEHEVAEVVVDQRPESTTRQGSSWKTGSDGAMVWVPDLASQRGSGGSMRAWTVDADDIRVAEDFDESLLHRTPEIDSFLTPDRDDKFIVIGTKGFGKTLLLKAKRILYQREGARGLPARRQPARQADRRQDLRPGGAGVLRGVSAAVVEALAHGDRRRHAQAPRRGRRASRSDPRLASSDRPTTQLHGVIDHFVRLLDFTPSELQRARHRHRRPPRAAAPRDQGPARHLHRRRRRVLQQARREPSGSARASPASCRPTSGTSPSSASSRSPTSSGASTIT